MFECGQNIDQNEVESRLSTQTTGHTSLRITPREVVRFSLTRMEPLTTAGSQGGREQGPRGPRVDVNKCVREGEPQQNETRTEQLVRTDCTAHTCERLSG